MITCEQNGWHETAIFVKCDSCGKKSLVDNDQTDRLIAHDWIHSHGWKTMKRGEKWIQLCDECVSELRKTKREKYISRMVSK